MPPSSTLLSNLLLAGIVALIVVHAVSLWYRKRFLMLDPLFAFWGGALVIYVEQPLFHGRELIGWHGEGVFEETLFWTFFGLLFVVLGYETRLGTKIGNKLPRITGQLSRRRLFVGAWALNLIAMAGYVILFESAGGFASWIAHGRGGTNFESLSGYVLQLPELLPIGVVLLLFRIQLHPTAKVEKVLVWGLVLLLLWWFIYYGSRARVIALALQVLAAVYLPKQKNPSLTFAISAYVAVFAVVSLQASFRSRFTNLSLNLDQIEMSELRKALPFLLGGDPADSMTFSRGAEFDCAMATVELVPEKIPYNYGYCHVELFTRWIPRSLWQDKIYPHRDSIQDLLRDGQLSSASLPGTKMLAGPAFAFVGHWYHMLGPVGLLLGGLLTGIILRVIRTIYDRGKDQPAELIVYASLIWIGFSEAATTPLLWVYTLPFTLGPLLIVLVAARERRAEW